MVAANPPANYSKSIGDGWLAISFSYMPAKNAKPFTPLEVAWVLSCTASIFTLVTLCEKKLSLSRLVWCLLGSVPNPL